MYPVVHRGLALRIFRYVLAGGVVCFIGAAFYLGSLLIQRHAAINPLGKFNESWLVAQAPSEFARLEQRISGYPLGGKYADAEEVQLRLDIVQNRLNTLRSGFLAPFIASDPRHGETLRELGTSLALVRPLTADLAATGAVEHALDLLEPVYPKLVRLSVDANTWNSIRTATDREKLSRLQLLFTWATIGLIICGSFFISLLLFHNRLLAHTSEELKSKDKALERRNEWFEAAIENMSQGLCLTDPQGRLLVCNERFLRLFGLSKNADCIGLDLETLIPETVAPPTQDTTSIRDAVFRLTSGQTLAVSHELLSEGGWVSTFHDISERQRSQDRIAQLAHYDSLTGLLNRFSFWNETEHALQQELQGTAELAVVYLDLDRFKEVNDTLGHLTGDTLLKEAAARLREVFGQDALVARLGGDEFGVVLQQKAKLTSRTIDLVEKLLASLSEPFQIEGREVRVTTCAGIAFAPNDGSTCDDLLKKADLALYAAKLTGANTYRCFNSAMEKQAVRRRQLGQDLRSAIEQQQLEMYYQPLVTLGTMQIGAGEGLLRWTHPKFGPVSPSEFIPIAEETGCIDALGAWALRRALNDANKWPEHVRVSVNLSPMQFKNVNLRTNIAQALEESGFSAERLDLEVTESVLMQDTKINIDTLNYLASLGVKIALDDFGTGYSSLSYLMRFPLSKIKIDQSFVRGMGEKPSSIEIIKSVSELAKRLGMTTVAEGIETWEQLQVIISAGCDEVQGYYFSSPVTEPQFRALIKDSFGIVPRPEIAAG